ncbi:MAG: hypothetical protein ACXU8A_07565 [Burkholderiaceae bacterium]
MAHTFASLMLGMLRELKIPEPEGLHQEVCTLHFDGHPDMHFVNHVSQYVDVLSEAGALAAPFESPFLKG